MIRLNELTGNIIYYGVLMVVIVLMGIQASISIDCNYRAKYWNDKGLFIDCWDCNTFFMCDYPEIPKNEGVKPNE